MRALLFSGIYIALGTVVGVRIEGPLVGLGMVAVFASVFVRPHAGDRHSPGIAHLLRAAS